MFSIPLNPKLSEEQFYYFLEFCKKYKNHIFDIYFTCRIPPFTQDAMGDIFQNEQDNLFAIQTALFIQSETGIKISATFNNINIRPDQNNLDIWIENFKPLYQAGIRSCTLPHTSWMLTGQIQKEFPQLFVKNTILRNISEANQIAELAKAGFNYINLDRDLMRNHLRLKEVKKVKEKYNIKISLLANESCKGNCPLMDEHYTFNNTRNNNIQFFNDPISRVSCSKWENTDKALPLKTANLSPWREDWDEYKELGIDVFKMHGRESIPMLFESLDIIEKYINKQNILYSNFEEYFINNQIKYSDILLWRDKIKQCKFDCWDCTFCDTIVKKEKDSFVKQVNEIIISSVNDEYTNNIQGLTSPRIKKLLNSLGKIVKSYLEIGVLNGSTFCSTIENNNLTAYAIDIWKDEITSLNNKKHFKPSKNEFIKNVESIKGDNNIIIFDNDFRNVDLNKIDNIDLMFYDADHSKEMTHQAITYFSSKFKDNTILIFDDANWQDVVSGVDQALEKNNLKIKFSRLILNDIEDETKWWNGLYIVILEKQNIFSKQNLILTKSCDKKCSFCFTHDYDINSEMSLDFIKELITKFPEINSFNLLGGEPTQHSQFKEILDYLEKNNIEYRLISNLLFDKDILQKLSNSKSNSFLCNGMELDINDRLPIFSYNWNNLNKNHDCYLAFTISKYHTESYFSNYCDTIKPYIKNIKYIRIGLDLNGDYIINNHSLGNIIKIIWESLANKNTELIFDCFIPHCIFNYNIETLKYMTPYKYQYNANCEGAIGDIFNDGSMIYCYPLKDIKIDNIIDSDINIAFKYLNDQYNNINSLKPVNKQCLDCNKYNKICAGVCLACK